MAGRKEGETMKKGDRVRRIGTERMGRISAINQELNFAKIGADGLPEMTIKSVCVRWDDKPNGPAATYTKLDWLETINS